MVVYESKSWTQPLTGVAFDVIIIDHEPATWDEDDYLWEDLWPRVNPDGMIMVVDA